MSLIRKLSIPAPRGHISAIMCLPDSCGQAGGRAESKTVVAGQDGDIKLLPLAVLMPGYLDSKDHLHLSSLAEDLADAGYASVRFDPTGTWQSMSCIDDYSVTQYLSDVDSVVNYCMSNAAIILDFSVAAESSATDPSSAKPSFGSVFLIGHSMGGMVALLHEARHGQSHYAHAAGIVAIMSPYAFVRAGNSTEKNEASQWALEGFKLSRRTDPLGNLPDGQPVSSALSSFSGNADKKGKREYKVPYSMVKDASQYDVLKVIREVRAPLLFIAAQDDEIVSPADVELMYSKANEPKNLVVLENVGHDYRLNNDDVRRVNEKIIDWLLGLRQPS